MFFNLDYRDTCGIVYPSGSSQYHSTNPYITQNNGAIYHTATQYASTYLRSTSTQKKLSKVYGSDDVTDSMPMWTTNSSIFQASNICKYALSSGTKKAIEIKINKFNNPINNGGRVQIYGGKTGSDVMIFDSLYFSGSTTGLTVTAPCGQATIILQSNQTGGTVDYGFDFDYQISLSDTQGGDACQAYSKYLQCVRSNYQ